MTMAISGFADEISPDLDEQLTVLAAQSITHLELRSVWSVNVADLDGQQVAAVRRARYTNGKLHAELVDYLNSPAINERTADDKSLVVGCRITPT